MWLIVTDYVFFNSILDLIDDYQLCGFFVSLFLRAMHEWFRSDKDYTRVTLKLLTLPPPPERTKTKDLFIKLRCNCFRVSTVGVGSFFKPVEPRLKEREKLNFSKEPQRRPSTMINFRPSQNCHSLRTFSQF